MFSDLFIEKVKDANDIVNVVSEYVTLERKGKDFFGLCPFHNEKTASFSVVPSKQIYYCFGCGKGGNVFHFIMEQERLSFVEAVEFLAEKAGIPIERTFSAKDIKEDNLRKEVYAINKTAARFFFDLLRSQEGRTAQEYLIERRIKVKTANTFGLGYSSSEWTKLYDHVKDKGYSEECLSKCGLFTVGKNGNFYDRFRNRLMFPIFDASGNVVGFGGRRLSDAALGIGSDGHKEAKYINSTETPVYIKGRNLYGLNFVKAGSVDKLIIVEGYMDVIAMHQAGFTNSVASLGTALTERQAKLMKKYTAYVAYNSGQDIVWLVETGPGTGYAKIVKKDTNPDLTNNNKIYGLDGAVFGIYRDAACTDKAGSLTTKSGGTTDALELEAGTYYVQEEQAPPGYVINEKAVKIVVEEDETATATVGDHRF